VICLCNFDDSDPESYARKVAEVLLSE